MTRSLFFAAWAGALMLAACEDPTDRPNVASNTNWLTQCTVSNDCSAGFGCNCGACSKACASDTDCSSVAGTACVLGSDDAATALCHGSVNWSSAGVCLPRCVPGGCGAQQACSLGVCVPMALPDSVFCSAASGNALADRIQEEDLLSAVAQSRAAGGIVCGSTTASRLPLVRLDSRLTCTARVLAQDIVATSNASLTDSAGRTTTDRLALAGYQQRSWVEGYAWDVTNATAALQKMLSDGGFCDGFVDASLTDVGAGHAGNTYVLTLATE